MSVLIRYSPYSECFDSKALKYSLHSEYFDPNTLSYHCLYKEYSATEYTIEYREHVLQSRHPCYPCWGFFLGGRELQYVAKVVYESGVIKKERSKWYIRCTVRGRRHKWNTRNYPDLVLCPAPQTLVAVCQLSKTVV